MTLEEVKAWSGVFAALVAALSAAIQYYLVKEKEWKFEKERHAHEKNMQEEKQRHSLELEKARQKHEERLQNQRIDLDAWRQVREAEINRRILAFRKLQSAVTEAFESFAILLKTAAELEDHEIVVPLSRCIASLSKLDEATEEADSLIRERKDKARLNRLRMLKRFFLGIVLDLTRRKSERKLHAERFAALAERLRRRREVALRHVQIVVSAVSTPPTST